MALVAGDRFPELREAILGVTIATTIAFEIAGPFATLLALDRGGPRPKPLSARIAGGALSHFARGGGATPEEDRPMPCSRRR